MRKPTQEEVMTNLLNSLAQLGGKLLATQSAVQSLLSVLPSQQQDQFAAVFRETVDDLLGSTMDHPGGNRTVKDLMVSVNAYLEAAGHSPGQPGTPL